MYRSLFFRKEPTPATFFKNTLWHSIFPVNFEKYLRTPFSQHTYGWLLLYKHTVKHCYCELFKRFRNRTKTQTLPWPSWELTLSWRRPLSNRNQSANQWTGFYMIVASVMKELKVWTQSLHLIWLEDLSRDSCIAFSKQIYYHKFTIMIKTLNRHQVQLRYEGGGDKSLCS